MAVLQLGATLPDLTVQITGDKSVHFAHYRGKNVLLYFYPKDNTPTCTQQAHAFRESYGQFEVLNTLIFGVSRDSVRSHENFKSKHALPFDLIADVDEQLCELFGVMKMKNLYGKQVRGIERSSFLFNSDGVLIGEWRKVNVKAHCAMVLQALNNLNAVQISSDN